ncbi:MAG: hypothetical protein AAGF45_03665 [Pseudomonadota bacterium]
MRLLLVGVWAVFVTLGTGYAVASWKLADPGQDDRPRFEGLRYTSLPTLSVPVLEDGEVKGYVVVRVVYTADAAVLRGLSAGPDPFISDELFRALYSRAETVFGRLVRLDLGAFAEDVRTKVNARMGDEVIQDLLIDGLNYVDLARAGADTAPGLPREETPAAQSEVVQ